MYLERDARNLRPSLPVNGWFFGASEKGLRIWDAVQATHPIGSVPIAQSGEPVESRKRLRIDEFLGTRTLSLLYSWLSGTGQSGRCHYAGTLGASVPDKD